MDNCTICNGQGKYKCPTCLVYYCSVGCCKKHRNNGCTLVAAKEKVENSIESSSQFKYPTKDTVPTEKLALLRENQELKDLLRNPHLRNLLKTVNDSKNPEQIMQMVMQEPLFVEFSDACMKTLK